MWVYKTTYQIKQHMIMKIDTRALRREEATNVPGISTFVPPNLETRLGSVPGMPQVMQSSIG